MFPFSAYFWYSGLNSEIGQVYSAFWSISLFGASFVETANTTVKGLIKITVSNECLKKNKKDLYNGTTDISFNCEAEAKTSSSHRNNQGLGEELVSRDVQAGHGKVGERPSPEATPGKTLGCAMTPRFWHCQGSDIMCGVTHHTLE